MVFFPQKGGKKKKLKSSIFGQGGGKGRKSSRKKSPWTPSDQQSEKGEGER